MLPVLALLFLAGSYAVAVTTESQAAAQLSWLLVGAVVLTTAGVRRYSANGLP